MVSTHKLQYIISTPTLNNITFKEWQELPLGIQSKEAFMLGCNGFCSEAGLTAHLAEDFQKYKDYVSGTSL